MENRVKQVRQILKIEKLNALLISSSINIRYLTGFLGFDEFEREGYALITQNELYLFANSLYATEAKIEAKNSVVVELSKDNKLVPSLQRIIDSEKIKDVGFEKNLTYSEFKIFKKLKNIKLKLSEEVVEEIRTIKDANELESLKKACELTDKTCSRILENMRINITEKEVAWEIEKYIREHGGKLAFPSIVAFGKNSATPHHKTSNYELRTNNIVLLDFGAKINGYSADMTRTLFFGKASSEFKKMYDAVLVAQKKAFTPKKITPEDIDKTARDYITKQEYPSVPHSIGHGVGLQIHELPHISPGFTDEILPNTPFTIEPGIYIPNFGGVRIEDTVYFDGKQIISLTHSPKTLLEL